MTLAECIERHEAQRLAQPASGTLSPLGAAHVAARRLARALADLSSEERAHVHNLLTDLLWMPAPRDPAA